MANDMKRIQTNSCTIIMVKLAILMRIGIAKSTIKVWVKI